MTHNKMTLSGGGLGSGHFCYVAKRFLQKNISYIQLTYTYNTRLWE